MAALQLNGVASYNELNKEYYIAGLLLNERISNPVEIVLYKKHKQMKLIVTADRWSPRQWKKQWQNNIAINNTLLNSGDQLQKDLAYFTSFLSKDLTNGDELIIEYQPQTGTQIQLNSFEFITTQDDRLFNYLVNTWIGDLPPSRDFKNRILSIKNDSTSVSQKQLIMTHTVTASRQIQTNSWFKQSSKEKEKAEEAARIEEQRQRKSALKQQQAEKNLAEQELIRIQNLKKSAAEKLAQAKAAEAKRREKEQAAEKARIQKLKLIKERKAQEAQLAQYYFRDLHEWKLRQAVLAEVKYPAWARQFQQEGVVDAQFTVNRKGIVSDVSFEDENTPEMLMSEVLRAIKISAQKLLPPDELNGTQWEFSVTYKFDLLSRKQKALISPKIPDHMINQGSKYNLEEAGKYMQSIRARVLDAMKYPSEAVMLKKRGTASIFVTMDNKGNVVKIFERYKSKHAVLTSALIDAVERAKPLPAMPVDLGKDTITVDIEYEFRR